MCTYIHLHAHIKCLYTRIHILKGQPGTFYIQPLHTWDAYTAKSELKSFQRLNIYLHTYAHKPVSIYPSCVCVCMCIYIYIHIYIYTRIHAHIKC